MGRFDSSQGRLERLYKRGYSHILPKNALYLLHIPTKCRARVLWLSLKEECRGGRLPNSP
ncbi:MAG: hypothetical protein QXX71_01370 [Candidatus Nanoarchaeia archaeon]|nr:hypothetical protein [Candidatus Haiyanarchaeum thermophilum]MCW1307485.1 hypothetical protein [Candidatus Haiyanarchaeum thermophilum]